MTVSPPPPVRAQNLPSIGVWARTAHNESANLYADCAKHRMRDRAHLELIVNHSVKSSLARRDFREETRLGMWSTPKDYNRASFSELPLLNQLPLPPPSSSRRPARSITKATSAHTKHFFVLDQVAVLPRAGTAPGSLSPWRGGAGGLVADRPSSLPPVRPPVSRGRPATRS